MRIVSRLTLTLLALLGLAILAELIGVATTPSWSVSASAVSSASPAQIWRWYTDAADVPRWDHLVQRVDSGGAFASGTAGDNVAINGMVMPWVLADVVTDVRYTEISQLPLARMTATHVLTKMQRGTQIEHALVVSGPAAWVYRLAAYRQMNDGIHAAMQRLATGAPHGLP